MTGGPEINDELGFGLQATSVSFLGGKSTRQMLDVIADVDGDDLSTTRSHAGGTIEYFVIVAM